MEQENGRKVTVKVNKSPAALIVFILMPIIGIGMIIYGVVYTQYINEFAENCKTTTGIVIGSDSKRVDNSDHKRHYWAIYEYEVDGQTYTVKESVKSLIEPTLGDDGKVYYDPANPSDARTVIKEGNGYWAVAVGVVAIIFGAVFLKARFKGNSRVKE